MVQKTPLVTVITPTFNRAYILPNAIDSVLAQTYTHFEYLIVDDGATDNTEALVKKYHDTRIKYIRQGQNLGPSAARNIGLSHAKGEWITYLDDDDNFYPNLLEVMVKKITAASGVVFAIPRGTKTLELYENNKLIREIDNSDNYPESITTQDIAYKTFHFDNIGLTHSRKVIEDGISFDTTPELGALEDWEFGLQLAENYPEGLLYVKDVLFHYHQRYGTDGRVSNDTYAKSAIAFEYVYQKHKHDKILKGQKWYPERVEKYKTLQSAFDKGAAPPKYLLPFT